MEMIRLKITIYFLIKQNIFEFNSKSRVREVEHSTGKSPVCFWFRRQSQTAKHSETLDASMEESHLQTTKPPQRR